MSTTITCDFCLSVIPRKGMLNPARYHVDMRFVQGNTSASTMIYDACANCREALEEQFRRNGSGWGITMPGKP